MLTNVWNGYVIHDVRRASLHTVIVRHRRSNYCVLEKERKDDMK
jgi:hypothetical protein